MKLDRRRFLGSSVGVAAAAGMTAEWVWPKHTVSYRRPLSAVAVLNAAEYSESIEALLLDGLRLFRLQVLGRSILLKPNLVEDLPGPVNTNSALIGAAARCFLRLGAVRVVIAEGPQAASRGTADRVRGSQPRRAQKSEAESQLQRSRRALAAECGSRIRLRCFNAQSEDTSLGGGHAELEKHVRCCARHEVRLAEESTALERNSRKHPRHLCDRSDPLRDRRRYYRNGRQRTASGKRPPTGQDCTCR